MPHVDPNILANLNGTNGFIFTGLSTTTIPTSFSIAVGDMNGDGINEIAIGNSFAVTHPGSGNDGDVYVFRGQPNYPTNVSTSTFNGSNGFRVVGYPKGNLGQSVAFIDLNKDGFDDLVVGSPETSKFVTQFDTTGFAYVIYGKSSGSYPAIFNVSTLNGVNGFTLGGAGKNNNLGVALAGGDINGDGLSDLISGASMRTCVLYGQTSAYASFINTTSLNGANGFTLTGTNITFGTVDAADIDQDGIADLIAAQAKTYVLFGKETFPASTDISELDGNIGFSTSAINGKALLYDTAKATDMNDDGYPDLVLGAPINTIPGRISVVFSHARPYLPTVPLSTSMDGIHGFNLTGLVNDDYVGAALSHGVMGGKPVIVTGSYYSSSFAGAVFGVFATSTYPATQPIFNQASSCRGFRINGVPGQLIGAATRMGDLNNDGHDDIIIKGQDKAYVVYGKPYVGPALNLSNTNLTYTEGDPALILDNNLKLDGGGCGLLNSLCVNLMNIQPGDLLTLPAQPNLSADYDSETGILTLNGRAPASEYQTALRAITFSNFLQNLNPTPRRITFAGSDGVAHIMPVTITVNVVPVNDLPMLMGNSSPLTYTSNQALIIDDSISLSDFDSESIVSAQVSINGFTSGDVLSFADQYGITGYYNSAIGILTLAGSASLSEYASALRSVTYQNNAVDVSNRSISFVVNDGMDNSNVFTRNINLVPLNSLLSGNNDGLICFSQNQSEHFIAPQLSVTGGAALTLESATVTISNSVATDDILEFSNLGNGITGNYDSSTGALTLSGPATASDFEATLQTVKYRNSNNDTNSAMKTITVAVDYAGLSSNTLQSQIDLITINDSPVVINSVPDFDVTVDEPFAMVLNNNTFSQPVSELTLSVKENDAALTSLSFDATTRTLNGSFSTVGENRFGFFASDRCNQTAASNFNINVVPPVPPIEPTVAPLTDSNTTPNSPAVDKTGPLVGGLIGGIGGLLLIVGGIVLWRRKRKEDDDKTEAAFVNAETMVAAGQEGPINNNPLYQKKTSWYNRLYKSLRSLASTRELPKNPATPTQPVEFFEEVIEEKASSSHTSSDHSEVSIKSSASSNKSEATSEESEKSTVTDSHESSDDSEESVENSATSSPRLTP